jgi:hypothetical protein
MTCARCGQALGEWMEADKCSAHQDDNSSGVIDCRNRELANLRSLLRSVTGKLEKAGDLLTQPSLSLTDQQSALELVESVMEVLS